MVSASVVSSSGCSVVSYNSTGTEGSNISYCRSLLKGSFHYSNEEPEDNNNETDNEEPVVDVYEVPKSSQSLPTATAVQKKTTGSTRAQDNDKATYCSSSTQKQKRQQQQHQNNNDDEDDNIIVILDDEDDDITNYDIFQDDGDTPAKDDDYSVSTHLTTAQFRPQQQQREPVSLSKVKEESTTEPNNTNTSPKTIDTAEDNETNRTKKTKNKKKNRFKSIVKTILRPFRSKNKKVDGNESTLLKPTKSNSYSSSSKRKRFDTATSMTTTTLTTTSSTQDLIGTAAGSVPVSTSTTASPVIMNRPRNTSSVTFQDEDDMMNNTATSTTTTTTFTKQPITTVMEEEKKDEGTIPTLPKLDPNNTTNNSTLITMEWLGGEKNLFPATMEYDAICTIFNQLSYDEQQTIYTRDWTIPVRHYRAEKGHIDKAVNQIKKTLAWRKEFGVDEINECWGPISDTDPYKELHDTLGEENRTGKIYVRGYDNEGRALMYMTPAWETQFHELNNMKHLVWNLEKAIACTARKSVEVTGRKLEKINLLIDYDGFRIKDHTPPLSTTKYTLEILQKHYPERMFHAYLLHPPPVFRVFWTCIKAFVDPNTKEKIVFCSGSYGLRYLTDNVTDIHKLEIRSGYEPLIISGTSSTNNENDKNKDDPSATQPQVRPFDSKAYQLLPRNIAYDE